MYEHERVDQARALYDRPLDSTETPEGQRYAIGEKIRVMSDVYAPWGLKKGDSATIEYSYGQKYGWMSGPDPRHLKMYSVKFPGNTLAWIEEREIEAAETPLT